MPHIGKTALLVEDDITIRVFLRSYLRRSRMSVIEADNGLDALRQMGKVKLSLIITDLSMPGMNGIDFIKEVRKSDRRISIIAITGAGESLESKALDAGANMVLHKPIFRIGLMDAIAKALEE